VIFANRVGLFNYGDPGDVMLTGMDRIAIFSDLATNVVFSLTSGGAVIEGCSDLSSIDGFVALDPLTLDATGGVTSLSSTISAGCSNGAILAGMGMVLVYDGTNVQEISLTDGTVTDLGSNATFSGAETCEEWAFWGVAERFGGNTYAVYRAGGAIVREDIATGTTEVILDLAAIETATGGTASDLCSLSIHAGAGLWVYHAEDIEDMLGAPLGVDTEEVLGICPAVIEAPAAG
jgi:hypothetical protein